MEVPLAHTGFSYKKQDYEKHCPTLPKTLKTSRVTRKHGHVRGFKMFLKKVSFYRYLKLLWTEVWDPVNMQLRF